MELVVSGDKKAFSHIHERYYAAMHRYFLRMLNHDQEKAADFNQDLFLKIIVKASYYDPSKKFSTWLYTLAGNMCKNEYRRSKPVIISLEHIQQSESQRKLTDKDRTTFREHLAKALDHLDPMQKECFILRFDKELSIKEIANVMHCPEGTVKSRIFYALKNLSKQLVGFKALLEKNSW